MCWKWKYFYKFFLKPWVCIFVLGVNITWNITICPRLRLGISVTRGPGDGWGYWPWDRRCCWRWGPWTRRGSTPSYWPCSSPDTTFIKSSSVDQGQRKSLEIQFTSVQCWFGALDIFIQIISSLVTSLRCSLPEVGSQAAGWWRCWGPGFVSPPTAVHCVPDIAWSRLISSLARLLSAHFSSVTEPAPDSRQAPVTGSGSAQAWPESHHPGPDSPQPGRRSLAPGSGPAHPGRVTGLRAVTGPWRHYQAISNRSEAGLGSPGLIGPAPPPHWPSCLIRVWYQNPIKAPPGRTMASCLAWCGLPCWQPRGWHKGAPTQLEHLLTYRANIGGFIITLGVKVRTNINEKLLPVSWFIGSVWYQLLASDWAAGDITSHHRMSGSGHQVIIAGLRLMCLLLLVPGQTSFQVCYVCDEQRGQGQGE